MKRTILWAAFGIAFAPVAVWSHGTERHFGHSVNGESRARLSPADLAPEFMVLALESQFRAIQRALMEEQANVIPKRTDEIEMLCEELLGQSAGLKSGSQPRSASLVNDLLKVNAAIETAVSTGDFLGANTELGNARVVLRKMRHLYATQ